MLVSIGRPWYGLKAARLILITAGTLLAGFTLLQTSRIRDGQDVLRKRALPPLAARSSPSVTIAQGTFQGASSKVRSTTIEAFLGIPYAKTTGGDNRFRAPVKVDDGTGVHDATRYGHTCWSGSEKGGAGDDCLNINVWRPSGVEKGQKVPVAVYIHGGSFTSGSGNDADMPNFVALSAEPMIGVTINYRLGALGFLSSGLAAKEGILNLGLRDQALALEWLQDNIEAFGGDKNAVTIWGFSAGAHSVGHHLMNTDGPTTFQRAILESGGPTGRACYPYDNALVEKQFEQFLNLTGTSGVPDDKKLEHLRSLDPLKLSSASAQVYSEYNEPVRWPWQPVIDGPGGFIPEAPIKSWKKSSYRKVPILTGFNTDDGTIFVPRQLNQSTDFTDTFATLLPKLSKDDLRELNELYPDPNTDPKSPYRESHTSVGRQFLRLAGAYGDYAYISPVRQTAHYASAANSAQDAVFLYQFDANTTAVNGTYHGSQEPYVFDSQSLDKLPWKTNKEIGQQMQAYWASFILTGDVNGVKKGPAKDRAAWAPYKEGASNAKMVFGYQNDLKAGGGSAGYVTQSQPDTWKQKEGDYWWPRVLGSESN